MRTRQEICGIAQPNARRSSFTPKPKPSRFSGALAVDTVTALFDYEAQTEGDLSFMIGDVIMIVARTNNENEWWTGKLNGK